MNLFGIIDEILNGDWNGVVSMGNVVATTNESKYNLLREQLHDYGFTYDYDEDPNENLYLIIVYKTIA